MYEQKNYYIYIATNFTNSVLYVGVTNNLIRRIYEHKNIFVSSFTSKYKVNKLVYFEIFDYAKDAILREKQLKAGSRLKKELFIKTFNPTYKDLYNEII